MELAPIPTNPNGRTGGRFALGNQAAKGHSSHGQRLRAAVLVAISVDDVAAIIGKLVDAAKEGDIRATKLVLDFIGRPRLNERPSVISAAPMRPMPQDVEQAKALLIARALRLPAASSE